MIFRGPVFLEVRFIPVQRRENGVRAGALKLTGSYGLGSLREYLYMIASLGAALCGVPSPTGSPLRVGRLLRPHLPSVPSFHSLGLAQRAVVPQVLRAPRSRSYLTRQQLS